MSATDTTFVQTVNIDGYHWKDTIYPRTGNAIPALHAGAELHLPGPEASLEEHLLAFDDAWDDIGDPTSIQYLTADVPELYRKFANTPTTRDAVLAFANKYGFIGVGESIVRDADTNPDGSVWREYETVEFGHIWAREIATMRAGVEMLDLMDEALGTDTDELSKRFSWTNGDWHVRREYLPGYTDQGKVEWVSLNIWADEPESFTSLASDDITGVATEFLRAVVNQKLAGRVNATIVWDDEHTKAMLIYKPTSLLGAMWMQFAATLTRTNNSRACIECGEIFDFVRRNRVFCSEACQKRYGRRKARQSELR